MKKLIIISVLAFGFWACKKSSPLTPSDTTQTIPPVNNTYKLNLNFNAVFSPTVLTGSGINLIINNINHYTPNIVDSFVVNTNDLVRVEIINSTTFDYQVKLNGTTTYSNSGIGTSILTYTIQ